MSSAILLSRWIQTAAVRPPVDPLELLDTIDVPLRLRVRDPLSLLDPAVDVPLAGVVRGEREPLVAAVEIEQVAQVPRAVADVQLGVVEVANPELRPARPRRDALRGRRQQLHQPDRARLRARVGPEAALLVDDGGEERAVEPVVARVAADDLLVAVGVPEPLVPGRLRVVHRADADRDGRGDGAQQGEPAEERYRSSSSTRSTKRSTSSSEPSFTKT